MGEDEQKAGEQRETVRSVVQRYIEDGVKRDRNLFEPYRKVLNGLPDEVVALMAPVSSDLQSERGRGYLGQVLRDFQLERAVVTLGPDRTVVSGYYGRFGSDMQGLQPELVMNALANHHCEVRQIGGQTLIVIKKPTPVTALQG